MFKVIKQKTASLDVDSEKGFTPLCPTELPVPDGHLIADELNAQAKFCKVRAASKDVHPKNAIWIATEQNPQFTPMNEKNSNTYWNLHCPSGEKGSELIDGLPHVSEYDFLVFKGVEPDLHPYSACYHDLAKKISTGLIEWLRGNFVDTVIVGGLAKNYCVYETIIDLVNARFTVVLNEAATKAIGDSTERDNYLKSIGVIFIKDSTELYI